MAITVDDREFHRPDEDEDRLGDGQTYCLEIAVVESSGPFFDPGGPNRFFWLRSVPTLPAGSKARASVLVQSHTTGSWTEHKSSVSSSQMQEIIGLLSELCIPERDLRVESVNDTSDGWSKLFLRLQWDDRRFNWEVHMQSSGIEGEDADALRSLLTKLYGLFEVNIGRSII